MENINTYKLHQTGPETQTILDQVNTNTADIAQLRALYKALTQNEPVIIQPADTWPVADPEENVIYRVIDRVNTPPESYSDYMWNGTTMVLMATYDNAIDDVPTDRSENLVKSGGVFSEINPIKQKSNIVYSEIFNIESDVELEAFKIPYVLDITLLAWKDYTRIGFDGFLYPCTTNQKFDITVKSPISTNCCYAFVKTVPYRDGLPADFIEDNSYGEITNETTSVVSYGNGYLYVLYSDNNGVQLNSVTAECGDIKRNVIDLEKQINGESIDLSKYIINLVANLDIGEWKNYTRFGFYGFLYDCKKSQKFTIKVNEPVSSDMLYLFTNTKPVEPGPLVDVKEYSHITKTETTVQSPVDGYLYVLYSNTNGIQLNTVVVYGLEDVVSDLENKFPYINESVVEESKEVLINCARRDNDSHLVFLPDANGSYGAFWVRDYAMILDGDIQLTAIDILTAYNLIKSKIPTSGEKAYWVPDHILMDGTPVWRPGSFEEEGGWGVRASIDGIGFLVKIANKYVELTGDISFINNNIAFLSSALHSIMDNNHMVYVAPGNESCTFGFFDTVKSNGYIAYNTIQLYESFSILEKWAKIADISFESQTQQIKDAFNSTFVVKVEKQVQNSSNISIMIRDYSYIKNSTGLNSGQFDVWSTAYAVRCGILNIDSAIDCVNGLIRFYSEYIKDGQAKHVPNSFYYSQNAMWESYFAEPTIGTYQNGGYWLTPVYDLYQSFKSVNFEFAQKFLKDAAESGKTTQYPEWISDDDRIVNIYYGSSASYLSKNLIENSKY